MNIDYENFTYPSVVTFACQMTLRQWYAGQALTGILANHVRSGNLARGLGDDADDNVLASIEANWAFELADAMIQAEAKE